MSKTAVLETLLLRVGRARFLILFLFHALVFAACYPFAWLLRTEFNISPDSLVVIKASAPYLVGLQLCVAAFFGFFRGWWRYVGIADVLRLVTGTTVALLLALGIWYGGANLGLDFFQGVSRGVLLIDWAFVLLTLFGARVLVRLGKDLVREAPETRVAAKKVVIVGAGDAGEALAREIQYRPQLGMKVVAFVDDHRTKWNSDIRGIVVRGPISSVSSIASETGATEALLAIPSASGKRIREIIHQLAEAKITFQTIPGLDPLVSGKVRVTQLRRVNVDDLLRREEILLPGERVYERFHGKRIVITGAGGSIGAELALQILQLEPEALHLIERSELAMYEITRRVSQEKPWLRSLVTPHLVDCAQASSILERVRPTIVIHAAAHKHVPLGEENPGEYVRNNCLVARTFAERCEAAGAERFIFISTDKAINPTSVMGASKRAAEIAMLDLANRSSMKITVLRFGNVIGSSGSVVPLFLQQIAAGGPVTVTHPDVTRYFLRTSEVISLILQAAAISEGQSTYMLDMGEPIRIADLARDLIQLSNHAPDDIPITFTGLRPGEKLREDLKADGERLLSTEHPRIVMVKTRQPDHVAVVEWYRRLETAAELSSGQTIEILRQLIPEYTPRRAEDLAPVIDNELEVPPAATLAPPLVN